MSREFTYIRKYIILQNNYTNIENINPKGYGKIEVKGIKGVMNLNIENSEEDRDYRIYLLKDIDGQIREEDLGRIITDEKGNSRTNINLNLRDLESKGFSVDEIDAIVIRRGIDILLAGYIEKDNKVIDRFIKELIPEEPIYTEQIDTVEELAQDIEELSIEEPLEPIDMDQTKEIEEDKQITEAEQETQSIEDTEEVNIEEKINIEETQPIEEDAEEISLEEIQTDAKVYEESKLEEPVEYDSTTEDLSNYQSIEYARRLNHKNQMTNYILSILRFFPNIQPLRMYLHGYSWWQIEDRGREPYKGFLPYYNYLMGTNYRYPFLGNSTTCLNLIRKYGHYLFGMYKEGEEVRYYIYGVPGKFTIEEQPFKGITGFNTWYESTEDLGYWIIYIDPMTGKIIHPINPMVPRR